MYQGSWALENASDLCCVEEGLLIFKAAGLRSNCCGWPTTSKFYVLHTSHPLQGYQPNELESFRKCVKNSPPTMYLKQLNTSDDTTLTGPRLSDHYCDLVLSNVGSVFFMCCQPKKI